MNQWLPPQTTIVGDSKEQTHKGSLNIWQPEQDYKTFAQLPDLSLIFLNI